MLEKVQFRASDDTLILAGDLVNKGPKSSQVVRFARAVGAFAVVGNHELVSLHARTMRVSGLGDSLTGRAAADAVWTDDLSAEDVKYLKTLPYCLLPPLHDALVVHAGLVAGKGVFSQNRVDMVTMRNVVETMIGSQIAYIYIYIFDIRQAMLLR